MHSFVYASHPSRVIFGAGSLARLPDEVERLALRRVLVLTTPSQEGEGRRVADAIGARAAGIFARAAMHTPIEVTERAMAIVREHGVDGVVALGGGSATGLSKAIALRTDLPQIVVPTTYAGSEMTPLLGETRNGIKQTQSSPNILPEVVIYDVDLSLSLPVGVSVASGINAIAHAVEALYAREGNPVISMLAEEGIAALARALPKIHQDAGDRSARADALYGAWLCGICLGSVGMSLHHKLCHTLGGAFDLPHAETHTIVLPHAISYNAEAAPDAMARIARALGSVDAAEGVFDFAASLGARMALRDLGMPETGIDEATAIALEHPYWNPRPLDPDGIRKVIAAAWAGERPRRRAA